MGEAERRLGRIHVLVNNAAVMPDGPIFDIGEDTWDRAFAVNSRAVFFASQRAALHFAEHGGGVIVNIASANAIRSESPEAVYNASKAAVVSMTQSFAHELGHLGVRVVGVAPGETLTRGAGRWRPRTVQSSASTSAGSRCGGSAGPPQAAAVLFLASDDASFISGQTLVVDGGELSGSWWNDDDEPPRPRAHRRGCPTPAAVAGSGPLAGHEDLAHVSSWCQVQLGALRDRKRVARPERMLGAVRHAQIDGALEDHADLVAGLRRDVLRVRLGLPDAGLESLTGLERGRRARQRRAFLSSG